MKITFIDTRRFEALTALGLVVGHVNSDGGIYIDTPRNDGVDSFVRINGINYRFMFSFRADGGYNGTSLIYREGRYSSHDGVTDKAASTIHKLCREVFAAAKAHEKYETAKEFAAWEVKQSEIRDIENQIATLQEKLKKLKA
jgi:hypothetical protein